MCCRIGPFSGEQEAAGRQGNPCRTGTRTTPASRHQALPPLFAYLSPENLALSPNSLQSSAYVFVDRIAANGGRRTSAAVRPYLITYTAGF